MGRYLEKIYVYYNSFYYNMHLLQVIIMSETNLKVNKYDATWW